MANGRKDKKDGRQSLKRNPFKALKGFSVSREQARPPAGAAQGNSPSGKKGEDGAEEDLFAREMALLGVRSLDDSDAPGAADEAPQTEEKEIGADVERELFLEALGRLDVRFEDELPVEEKAEPSAVPRRMKQLRRGTLSPEACLDLHGLTRAEARVKVRHFLQNACHDGKKVVLIITGRGHGSEGEPVLRPVVERYLSREGRAWAAEWGQAPGRFGGAGALVVFLRGRS